MFFHRRFFALIDILLLMLCNVFHRGGSHSYCRVARPVERGGGNEVSYPELRDVWGPRRRPEVLSTPECAI